MTIRNLLLKRLDEIKATSLQRQMAFFLLKVNGMGNAIKYIDGLEKAKCPTKPA